MIQPTLFAQLATRFGAQMDAFLPLSADELAGTSARRRAQLFRLVDQHPCNCQASGLCTINNLDGISGPGLYGVDLRFATTTLRLCLSVDRWARSGRPRSGC